MNSVRFTGYTFVHKNVRTPRRDVPTTAQELYFMEVKQDLNKWSERIAKLPKGIIVLYALHHGEDTRDKVWRPRLIHTTTIILNKEDDTYLYKTLEKAVSAYPRFHGHTWPMVTSDEDLKRQRLEQFEEALELAEKLAEEHSTEISNDPLSAEEIEVLLQAGWTIIHGDSA